MNDFAVTAEFIVANGSAAATFARQGDAFGYTASAGGSAQLSSTLSFRF
jgi:hypothetical protein